MTTIWWWTSPTRYGGVLQAGVLCCGARWKIKETLSTCQPTAGSVIAQRKSRPLAPGERLGQASPAEEGRSAESLLHRLLQQHAVIQIQRDQPGESLWVMMPISSSFFLWVVLYIQSFCKNNKKNHLKKKMMVMGLKSVSGQKIKWLLKILSGCLVIEMTWLCFFHLRMKSPQLPCPNRALPRPTRRPRHPAARPPWGRRPSNRLGSRRWVSAALKMRKKIWARNVK